MLNAIRVAATALAVAGTALPAQDAHFLTTGDGTRFLLVPIDHQTVTWVNLQPANPQEEPAGMLGLSLAVARASRRGGLTERDAESADTIWEKALRRAPSRGSKIVTATGHVGISVNFPPENLRQVAGLLRVRTRRLQLRGIKAELAKIAEKRNTRLAQTPSLGLMRRMLAKFDATKGQDVLLRPNSLNTVTQDEALAYYRKAYAPARSLNVLTGPLDPAITEKILKQVFAKADPLPTPSAEALPTRNVPDPLPSKDLPFTLMLGCPLPKDMDGETLVALDLLVEYLAADADSFLPDHLRATGHRNIIAQALAPYPETGGIFLLAVTDTSAPVKKDSLLVVHLEQGLAKIATEAPDPARLARAASALRARRSALLREPEGLALLLARRWARSGKAPTAGLAEESGISAKRLRELARQIFALKGQTLILPELGK